MKAKKSLGQNFFINKNLGDHILNMLKNTHCDSVVEIGPGTGFFTEKLQKMFSNVTVIEKDCELSKELQQRFPNIRVINQDFLETDLDLISREDSFFFGSLPFNVSKPIIRKIIESNHFLNPAFFVIQNEVAKKYIYRPPYSPLSLLTSVYADCKKILDISPDSFRPKPHVNSSLISFLPNRKEVKDLSLLENLINSAFKHPRKNIHNNLKGTKFEKGAWEFLTLRPEQLSLEEYLKICDYSL